jgi:hypothetical protein
VGVGFDWLGLVCFLSETTSDGKAQVVAVGPQETAVIWRWARPSLSDLLRHLSCTGDESQYEKVGYPLGPLLLILRRRKLSSESSDPMRVDTVLAESEYELVGHRLFGPVFLVYRRERRPDMLRDFLRSMEKIPDPRPVPEWAGAMNPDDRKDWSLRDLLRYLTSEGNKERPAEPENEKAGYSLDPILFVYRRRKRSSGNPRKAEIVPFAESEYDLVAHRLFPFVPFFLVRRRKKRPPP